MTSHPAYIGGAPVNITFVVLKDVLKTIAGIHHITAAGMHHAFRLARAATGVKYKHVVFAVHGFCRTDIANLLHHVMVPHVSAFSHVHRPVNTVHHQHFFNFRT